ncbi:MAG: prephenate dehydratase [Leptolyngbya sp. SIO4C1]|nr:prephenate dehydratase [Leptolyngbya sp. SIO4C1]
MISIAYLGPPGTYSEWAAATYVRWLAQQQQSATLCAYPSIVQTIQATAQAHSDVSVVPIENSIGGSVANTLDTLWETDSLQIQQALVLPIRHALLSHAAELSAIATVYSHPQALSQCQQWLAQRLPQAQLIPTSSTTESLQQLERDRSAAAVSSQWAAQLYQLPMLAYPISDHTDNCTRFWILSRQPSTSGSFTSLAFSLPTNAPGALLKPLQLFATQNINMSRIESRPTKRALGDYHFFVDIEASLADPNTQAAVQLLKNCTQTLKVFGSYSILPMDCLEPLL